MTVAIAGDWLVTVGACLCALLQLGTYRISRRRDDHPMLTGGRALLLAGWIIGAGRFVYVMLAHGDLPLPPVSQLWLGLLEGGTILVTIHWIQHRGDDEWQDNRSPSAR